MLSKSEKILMSFNSKQLKNHFAKWQPQNSSPTTQRNSATNWQKCVWVWYLGL